jgi:predicted neuraminidase
VKVPTTNTVILGIAARIALAGVVFCPLLLAFTSRPPEGTRFAQSAFRHSAGSPEPVFEDSFISDEHDGVMVHSAAVEQFADGAIHSVWFQGTREGGNDVALYWAALDPSTGKWAAPAVLVDREQASAELERKIKTIGNPVLFTASSGRTWLFFVTVSVFGWSGGDVNYKYTDDRGQTWSPARRLLISPVPHSGTLVKGSAIEYADGSIGLPVYRSYDQYSFGELVHLASDGKVLGTVTMSNATRGALQPSVAVFNDHDAVALMRYNGDDPKRVLRSTTSDAGRTWTTPEKTDVPNPDSALATLELSDASMIIVFNNSTQYRNVLTLAHSVDTGRTWKVLYTFDQAEAAAGGTNEERSYPSMSRDRNGDIHLVYTWERKRIKHVTFNEAWVRKIDE